MLQEWESRCPYCGEPIVLTLDTSAGSQQYIEDCWVCCRAIEVSVDLADTQLRVTLRSEDD